MYPAIESGRFRGYFQTKYTNLSGSTPCRHRVFLNIKTTLLPCRTVLCYTREKFLHGIGPEIFVIPPPLPHSKVMFETMLMFVILLEQELNGVSSSRSPFSRLLKKIF
jgi:hypothetical protein